MADEAKQRWKILRQDRKQLQLKFLYIPGKIGESLHCNHARSYQYFAESIVNQNAFRCRRCSSVDEALGENCFEETDVYMGQPSTYQ